MRHPKKSRSDAAQRLEGSTARPKILRKVLPPLDVSDLRVLVIDDNPFAFSMIKRLLNAMRKTEIFACHQAENAIGDITRTKPDLVIVDLDMPGKSGLELIKEIRYTPSGISRELPILVASAHADREHVLEARNAGANWIVVKPLSFRNLYDGLVRVVLDDRPFIESPNYAGPCRRTSPRSHDRPAGDRRNHADPGTSTDEE